MAKTRARAVAAVSAALLAGGLADPAGATSYTAGTVIDGSITRTASQPDVFNDHRYDNRANIVRCCDGVIEARAIEEFQLPALDGPVASATLSVYLNALVSGTGGTISVWGYPGDGLVTGAPLPPSPNGVYLGTFPEFGAGDVLLGSFAFAPASRVDLDITAFLQGVVDGGSGWAGFNFRLAAPSSSLVSLNGESAGPATASYVMVNTVPVPPAVTLFGSALALLAGSFLPRRPKLR
jgi:hypothetical protein